MEDVQHWLKQSIGNLGPWGESENSMCTKRKTLRQPHDAARTAPHVSLFAAALASLVFLFGGILSLKPLAAQRVAPPGAAAQDDAPQGAESSERGEEVLRDDFRSGLEEGWSWVREHREYWRTSDRGLEIRVEPGNLWGPANDAKNVLVRPVPDPADGQVVATVTVENRPTEQYEQANLVWYYDDAHMVKLGQELVDGQLSIVMGREAGDRARTINIIPIDAAKVQLQFVVDAEEIRGRFREAGQGPWQEAGRCSLPSPDEPKISLQGYQGPADQERWVIFSEFSLRQQPAQ